MTDRQEVARVVQEALREAPLSRRDLGEDMEGSYGTVREWSRGARRRTQVSSVALVTRAERLHRLAKGMRSAIARSHERSMIQPWLTADPI